MTSKNITNINEKNKNFFSNNEINPLDNILVTEKARFEKFYREIFYPAFVFTINNPIVQRDYFKTMKKRLDYYGWHAGYYYYKAKRAYNKYLNFKNKKQKEKEEYFENHINSPEHFYYTYDNPIDFSHKLHRNYGFYKNEVVPFNLKYQGTKLGLKFLHDTRMCTVTGGVYAANTYPVEIHPETGLPTVTEHRNGKSTYVHLNPFSMWIIFEDETLLYEDALWLILPRLIYEHKDFSNPVTIVDKSLDKEGNELPKKRGKYVKVKNNFQLPVPQSEIDDINYLNSQFSEKLQDYRYTKRYQKDKQTGKIVCGRYQQIKQQFTKGEREFLLKRFNKVMCDFPQNNPRILEQTLTGRIKEEDKYLRVVNKLQYKNLTPEHKKMYRKIIKPHVIIGPGSKSQQKARGSITKQFIKIGIRKQKGETTQSKNKRWRKWLIEQGLPPNLRYEYRTEKQIQQAIQQELSETAEAQYLDLNNPLQYIEAQMARELQNVLIQIGEIPNSIHDGFIVSKQNKEYFEQQMKIIFNRVVKKNKNYLKEIIQERKLYKGIEKFNKKHNNRIQIEEFKLNQICFFQSNKQQNRIKHRNKNKIKTQTQTKPETIQSSPLCVFVNNFQVDYSFSFP